MNKKISIKRELQIAEMINKAVKEQRKIDAKTQNDK